MKHKETGLTLWTNQIFTCFIVECIVDSSNEKWLLQIRKCRHRNRSRGQDRMLILNGIDFAT